MVKRTKEKQYQSAHEHRANSQLRSGNLTINTSAVRKLPFNCCALSLIPFSNPVCTNNGIVFEKSAIEPFLAEHRTDPVTGKPMTATDLVALRMHKDEEGRWQCPVMNKPFADHTKIVAIKQNPPGNQANVYSYEAYHELNLKAKNFEDLTSGLKFNRKKDVIILNDPTNDDFNKRRDINTFYHIQNQRKLEVKAPQNNSIRHSVTATRILDKLTKSSADGNSTNKKRQSEDLAKEGKRLKIFSDEVTGTKYSKSTGSLTSTVAEINNSSEVREATEEEVLRSMFQVMRKRKKKGYVQMETNMGALLLEIHCDLVPRTSTNFFKLCEAKKYNGTCFHRLIRNFMIQGGQSSKEAKNEQDESIWGGAFQDEFHSSLKHDGQGILSMANAGPNTNRRQFFFTFRSCPNLDRKHCAFGLVVKGKEVLEKMEKIPTDKKDRPLEPIEILDTTIIENPVQEAEEAERKRIEARRGKSAADTTATSTGKPSKRTEQMARAKSQIGRYLPKVNDMAETVVSNNLQRSAFPDIGKQAASSNSVPQKKKKAKFGNFSGW